jgi:hypothetical protein
VYIQNIKYINTIPLVEKLKNKIKGE